LKTIKKKEITKLIMKNLIDANLSVPIIKITVHNFPLYNDSRGV